MTDDLLVFRKTVREFTHNESSPDESSPDQSRWREQHRPDAEVWTAAGAAGLLLTDIPELYSGGGGSAYIREPMKL